VSCTSGTSVSTGRRASSSAGRAVRFPAHLQTHQIEVRWLAEHGRSARRLGTKLTSCSNAPQLQTDALIIVCYTIRCAVCRVALNPKPFAICQGTVPKCFMVVTPNLEAVNLVSIHTYPPNYLPAFLPPSFLSTPFLPTYLLTHRPTYLQEVTASSILETCEHKILNWSLTGSLNQ
jgi:hypothetical protein